MAVAAKDENEAPSSGKIIALAFVVFWAVIGGECVKVMCKGSSALNLKPLLPVWLQIPPLVGMIFFGMFARNTWES
jgi:hypothetical protein